MSDTERALSLMELITVIAITLVIAAGVLLSFTAVGNKKLDATARSLVAEMMLARQRAASEHQDFILEFNNTTETYAVYEGSVSAANRLKEKTLDVDIASVTNWTDGAQTQLRFQSHTGYADDRVITLSSGGKSRTINITADTGYITIE